MKAFSFPWKLAQVPHGIIDITRVCNVSCQGCYNVRSSTQKTLKDVESDLNTLMAARQLHTISIVGGEPTMHPELLDIVRMIKNKKLRVALVTNGVLLDESYAGKLKKSGLDLVFLHIDSRQRREDLPIHPTREMVNALRNKKAQLLSTQGLETGLQTILYKSAFSELTEEIEFLVTSPAIHYLFITGFTDVMKFKNLRGNLESGFLGDLPEKDHDVMRAEELSVEEIQAFCTKNAMVPFIYLGSNLNHKKARWLIYKIAVLRNDDGTFMRHMLTSSLLERIAIELERLKGGKYSFYQTNDSERFRLQILLNAFMGGKLLGNLIFSLKAWRKKSKLYEKHILVQQGPTMTDKGVLEHCRNCPDAVSKSGKLVPVCISDLV